MPDTETTLKLILAEIKDMKKDLKEFKTSQDKQTAEFKVILKELKEENNNLKVTVKKLTSQNNQLNSEVSRLSFGLNNLFQDKLSNNLIVSGVPSTDGENLEKVMIELAKVLKINLIPADFTVKRILSKVNNKFSNLLVEFANVKYKTALLQQRKKISLVPSKLGFSSEDKREIFFFHHLTGQNQKLLAESRKLKNNYSFKFVWFQNNQILARKVEKSKIISIRSIADLDSIIQSIEAEPKKETFFDTSEVIEVVDSDPGAGPSGQH